MQTLNATERGDKDSLFYVARLNATHSNGYQLVTCDKGACSDSTQLGCKHSRTFGISQLAQIDLFYLSKPSIDHCSMFPMIQCLGWKLQCCRLHRAAEDSVHFTEGIGHKTLGFSHNLTLEMAFVD